MSFLILVTSYLCSSAHAAESHVVFEQTVNVYQPTNSGLGKSTPLTAGQDAKFESSHVYWVESRGFVPLLVLPQNGSDGKEPVKVNMPEVTNWPSSTSEKVLSEKLGALMDELTKFQNAMRSKNLNEAEQSYNRMVQISNIEYLNFIKASLRFAQGDMAGAKAAVTRALQYYPANEQGQKFLKSLERGG